MNKKYVCICGKEFDNPQKFNGHKQSCEEHITAKYGSLKAYYDIKNRNHKQGCETLKQKTIDRKQQEYEKWLSEQHTCEKCGKIMTEKFGSGRFCSKACANSRVKSDESKIKVSQSLFHHNSKQVDNGISKRQLNVEKYNLNPSRCSVCNAILPYEKRNNKTCGIKSCILKQQSIKMTNILADKGLHRTVPKRYKYGIYNGIHCDSSWELAFLMYCLDKAIPIKRCQDHFQYEINNHRHNYFPDFIVNDVYYEIKNYYTETVKAKISQFPKDKKLVIIDSKDIKKYINYCKEKYGEMFYTLYDRNFSSWMD